MRDDTITLSLEERYTPEKMAEIAKNMAAAQADLESVEQEKKVSDTAYKERINKFSADVSTFAKQYNKGYELVQVECDIKYDNPEIGKKSYFRMDNHELVSTHDMTWEQRQETIQFPLPDKDQDQPPQEA